MTQQFGNPPESIRSQRSERNSHLCRRPHIGMSERFVGDGRLRLSGRNDPSLSRLCHGHTASCQPDSSLSSAREGVPLAEPATERRRPCLCQVDAASARARSGMATGSCSCRRLCRFSSAAGPARVAPSRPRAGFLRTRARSGPLGMRHVRPLRAGWAAGPMIEARFEENANGGLGRGSAVEFPVGRVDFASFESFHCSKGARCFRRRWGSMTCWRLCPMRWWA
jgi:hypothetical protein